MNPAPRTGTAANPSGVDASAPLTGWKQREAPPGRRRVAWTQVVLASTLMVATLPGRTQGLGLVTEPMLADLKLERVAFANMNLGATLLGALACFPTGWAADRIGLRWSTALIALALGLTVWQLSAVKAGLVLCFILLVATRAFGQSALSLCSIVTVGRWFPRRAGWAMGVYSVLLSAGFALAFGVVGYSVRVNGWRAAWFQIALGLLFIIVPLVVVALREPASEAGRLSLQHAPPEQERETHDGLTLKQALRTGAFWLFAGSAAAFNLVSSGLGLFNEAVLAERGFDQKAFHLFLAVSSLISLGGQFLCGWLTRYWRYQSLTALALLLYALGLALIPLITHFWHLWGLALLLGVSGGMIIVIFFSVWSDLFGQRHLGRIQGLAQMLTVLASGLGPVLFARCADQAGSYAPLLLVLAGFALALSLAARAVRTPGPGSPQVLPRSS